MFGFIGKISALIHSIPTPVMGGVSLLLFGCNRIKRITYDGRRYKKTDLSDKRNLMIASVILVIGIGGAVLHVGESFQVEGMALASNCRCTAKFTTTGNETNIKQSKQIAS